MTVARGRAGVPEEKLTARLAGGASRGGIRAPGGEGSGELGLIARDPGRTCGAIEVHKVLCDAGCTADVIVAEAGTFIYASRSDGPAQARIFRIKEALPLAALPATRTARVLDAIHEAYPQFIDGINVLHTGLDNMGAVFRRALTLLNAGRIESTRGDYEFYLDGVTPSVARVLEVIDRDTGHGGLIAGHSRADRAGMVEDGLPFVSVWSFTVFSIDILVLTLSVLTRSFSSRVRSSVSPCRGSASSG